MHVFIIVEEPYLLPDGHRRRPRQLVKRAHALRHPPCSTAAELWLLVSRKSRVVSLNGFYFPSLLSPNNACQKTLFLLGWCVRRH